LVTDVRGIRLDEVLISSLACLTMKVTHKFFLGDGVFVRLQLHFEAVDGFLGLLLSPKKLKEYPVGKPNIARRKFV
jgi:hypothetical protein